MTTATHPITRQNNGAERQWSAERPQTDGAQGAGRGNPDTGSGPLGTRKSSHGEARATLLLTALLLALLAARLLALAVNGTELFFDEAQYWTWSRTLDFGYFSKPPVIAWLIRAASETCGMSPFCLRLPSPLIHTATAFVIYLIARRLYDDRHIAVWSALVFATLPGVSFSSGIISTDVPLLFFWALALYAFVMLLARPGPGPALLLGMAVGLGLLAKYAMIYFVGAAALYLLMAPPAPVTPGLHPRSAPAQRRRALARSLGLAVALALVLVSPNLWWNFENGGVTFAHTAANAKWTGSFFHPDKALEFLAAQFGVFGPILFAALLVIVWRALRAGLDEEDRLLLLFSVPVIALVTVQAFLSRAHANWAAVAYVAATILVTKTMIADGARRWMAGSLALHLVVMAALALGNWAAGRLVLPGGAAPHARVLGWQALAEEVARAWQRGTATGTPYGAVLTDRRDLTAELLYYLRDRAIPILTWRARGARPQDHYELTIPLMPGREATPPAPLLLAHLNDRVGHITRWFRTVEKVGQVAVPAGPGHSRTLHLYRLADMRMQEAPGPSSVDGSPPAGASTVTNAPPRPDGDN